MSASAEKPNPNKPTCPLKHFTWVIPCILAGSAAPSTPEDLDFVAQNFKTIVTLTEDPLPDSAVFNHNDENPTRRLLLKNNIHIPIIDRTVPTNEDFDKMCQVACNPDNWPIVARCKAGIGRTAYFLCAAFIALWLRQELPEGNKIDMNLRRMVPAPLTAARLIAFIKQTREINVDEKTLDFLISRWKIALYWKNSQTFIENGEEDDTINDNEIRPSGVGSDNKAHFSKLISALYSSVSAGGSANEEPIPQLENFRRVIRGVVSGAATPSLKGKQLLIALENAANNTSANSTVTGSFSGCEFRAILNVEAKPLDDDQVKTLNAAGIRVYDVPIIPGGIPSLAQCEEIGEVFLDKSNLPILVVCGGGRGRTGTAIAIGAAALRAAGHEAVAAIGKSTTDLFYYVRSHLGPFAVENIDQEKIVSRYNHYIELSNDTMVLPGVLSYSSKLDVVLHRPSSHWLAMQKTSQGRFASVVSVEENALPENTAKFLKEEKGYFVEHFAVKEGEAPSRASDVQRFFDFVQNPSHWPILLISRNGGGRSLTMTATALVALKQTIDTNSDVKQLLQLIVNPGNNNNKKSTFFTKIFFDSATIGGSDVYFNYLQKRQTGDGASLSPVTFAQRAFVDHLLLLNNTQQQQQQEQSLVTDEFLQSINGKEEIISKVFAFGDWGAPLEDEKKQKGYELFADTLRADARKNGKPDYIFAIGDNFYQDGAMRAKNCPHFARWRSIFLEKGPELRGVPWKVQNGNHDMRRVYQEVGGGHVAIMNFQNIGEEENPGGVWQMRGNNPADPPSLYYSWYHGINNNNHRSPTTTTTTTTPSSSSSVLFCGLDTNVTQRRCRIEQEFLIDMWPKQRVWLADQLDQAQKKEECLWKICFFHHPVYCTGAHQIEGDVLKSGLTLTDGRVLAPIEKILNDNGVDLCLNGHEHENSCRVRGTAGIIHVTAGACFENIRYGKTNPAPELHRCDWESDRAACGFARVTVTENKVARTSRLIVEYIRVPDLEVMFTITKVKNIPSKKEDEVAETHQTTLIGTTGNADDVDKATADATPLLNRSESARLLAVHARDKLRQAVILVDHPMMLETLAPFISQLRSCANVFVFNNSATAGDAIDILLERGVPIAAIITNMRRARPDSGIRFITKVNTLATFHSLTYSIPVVMFSWTASKEPKPSFDAGAFTVFSTNVDRLQTCVSAAIEANRWSRVAIDYQASAQIQAEKTQLHLEQGKITDPAQAQAAKDKLVLEELRYSNCMRPIPREFGGHILSSDRVQLVYTILCAAYEKLVKNLTKVIVEESVVVGMDDGGCFIFGEAAINYYSQVGRGWFSPEETHGRTSVLDIAVDSADAITPLVKRITATLQSSADIIRGYLAHASLRLLPNENNMDIVQVNVNHQNSAITSIQLSLEPVGDVPVCEERDKPKIATFSWTVARIHVRNDEKDGPLFRSAHEVGGAQDSTRYCSGLPVISAKDAADDMIDYFITRTTKRIEEAINNKKNEQEGSAAATEGASKIKHEYKFLTHRFELLKTYMETNVLPKIQ